MKIITLTIEDEAYDDSIKWLEHQDTTTTGCALKLCRSAYLSLNSQILNGEIESLKAKLSTQFDDELTCIKESYDAKTTQLNTEMEKERNGFIEKLGSVENGKIERIRELQTMNRIYEKQIETHNKNMENMTKEHLKLANHFKMEMERLNNEQRSFIQSLTGSTQKGQIGENFVDEIFSELELGVLENVSKKAVGGYADRLWNFDFPDGINVPNIRGLIEVKFTNSLHSKHDIEKFKNDVQTAGRQNRINCAILISLTARISGEKQISLSFIDGIPVLRASRLSSDSLTSSNLVKMAFSTLHQFWPYINSNKGTQDENFALETFTEFLDSQIAKIEKLHDKSKLLEKMGTNLIRESASILKIKDELAHDISSLRLRYPQLTTTRHDNNESGEVLQSVIDAVDGFRQRTKRYPKSIDDLKKFDKSGVNESVFKNAIDIVRLQNKPGKKRRLLEEEVEEEVSSNDTPK